MPFRDDEPVRLHRVVERRDVATDDETGRPAPGALAGRELPQTFPRQRDERLGVLDLAGLSELAVLEGVGDGLDKDLDVRLPATRAGFQ